MAPPTVTGTLPPTLRHRMGSDEPDQSRNPLGASFSGPAITVGDARGSGTLLLDPTDTSVRGASTTPTFHAAPKSSSSIVPPLPSPSIRPQSSNDSGAGGITHEVLVGVASVLAVLVAAGTGLILYLYWRKRRRSGLPRKKEKPNDPRLAPRPREVSAIVDDEMRDPFANRRRPLRPPAAIPPKENRDTLKTIQYTTDAGSVYVLDGESIYGDNGASVRGILPPAYDDIPSRAGRRGQLPLLPPHTTASVHDANATPTTWRRSDSDGDVDSSQSAPNSSGDQR